VNKCAEVMQVSPQFIRIGLQQGKFPWGFAIKMSGRWTYWISRQKFEESTGIKA
jgi:hypothetical protein